MYRLPTGIHWGQGGRVDENGVFAAVVHPHLLLLMAQDQALANLLPCTSHHLIAGLGAQEAQAEAAAFGQVMENLYERFCDIVKASYAGPVLPVRQFTPVAIFV